MSSQTNQRIQVPDSLRDVLLEFSIAYLSEQPKDVVDYAVEFFTKLQDKRRHNMVAVEVNSPDEESIMSQEEGESEWIEKMPAREHMPGNVFKCNL